MQLHFTGKNMDVTTALKQVVTEKLQALEKRNSHITTVNVVFHVEHGMHRVEATVHCDGKEIHADVEHQDMYAAIDVLAAKLLGQITKHKEKLIDNHR